MSLGSTETTVGATIDPSGEPTSYRVEYGTHDSEEFVTPEVSAGAARGPVSVSTTLDAFELAQSCR